jgi:hypothetical protein
MILLQLAEHTNRPTLVPYHGFFYFGTDLIMVDHAIYFLRITQYNTDVHNTHTHLPL